ncbi:T9SS type A sorting domain-containing protein [Rufibacter sp. LB8]|uniref:T9SS type A sorting domain-containing protein n=1 Tax=Rufibacter sp. LB8 TaxID=2777781 RepID=UPI00178C7645|nr:T9SS type A sorting domain-containing protein [Rufibacter sp. LB8]
MRNLTINASGNTVTLNAGRTVNGNFSITSGTFDQGANTLNVKGDFTHAGEGYIGTAGAVVLNGPAAQSVSTTSALAFNNLTVNNSAGVNLTSDNVQVNGALALTSGKITTNANTLTLGSAATISETATNYVVGKLATSRNVTGANNFGGIGFNITSGPAMGTTDLVRTSGPAGAVTVDGNTGINRKWKVTPATQPATPVAVTLTWPADDDNNAGGLRDFNAMRIYKTTTVDGVESSTYTDISKTNQAVNTASAIRSISGTVTSFSTLTVSDINQPLPVTLMHFNAKRDGEAAQLTWATAAEIDNAGFDIEASTDAVNFEKIGFVASNGGNSTVVKNYNYTDNRPNKMGTIYYRLTQVDTDGKSTTYGMKPVTFNGVISSSSAYPNPFTSEVTVAFVADRKQQVTLRLTDAMGKVVLQKVVTADAGSNQQTLSLDNSVPAGIYILTVVSDKGQENIRVVKQ